MHFPLLDDRQGSFQRATAPADNHDMDGAEMGQAWAGAVHAVRDRSQVGEALLHIGAFWLRAVWASSRCLHPKVKIRFLTVRA